MKEKGVTLVALVITIAVLLILAGVSIGTLTGRDGIIEKTKQVQQEQMVATEIEQIEVAYLKCKVKLNKLIEERKVTDVDLREELIKNQSDIDVTANETSEGYFIHVTFNTTKHTYIIDENGNVKRIVDEQFDTLEIDKKMIKQEISFQDSMATISNPDRGWYIPVVVPIDREVDIQTQCTNAIKENIQILQLRVNIGPLSGNVNAEGVDKDFTAEQLSSLNTVLDTIRKNKLNVIIRFAYTFESELRERTKTI